MVLARLLGGGQAFLIMGPIGAGKTKAAVALAQGLRAQGLPVGGVVSPRVVKGGQTVGYRVRDLEGNERPLCSRDPPGIEFRRFFFSPEGLAFANAVLARAAQDARVVIVDEVGPLELTGGGLAPGVQAALRSPAFLVLSVRPWLVGEVLAWAGLPPDTPAWEVGEP